MTIDLNERLGRLAAEATDGLELEHPSTVRSDTDTAGGTGDEVGRARRRRLATVALAIASAAAVVAAVVVLTGNPAEVLTTPAGVPDDAAADRAHRVLAALRTDDWTASIQYRGGRIELTHTPEISSMTAEGEPGGGGDVEILHGSDLYLQDIDAMLEEERVAWIRSTFDTGDSAELPFIERLLVSIESIPCWRAGRSDSVLVGVQSCDPSPTTTIDGLRNVAATLRLDGERLVSADVTGEETDGSNSMTIEFDYDDVPTITVPDPSLVEEAPTNPAADRAQVGQRLPALPGSLFELDQSLRPKLLVVIATWSPNCADIVDALLAVGQERAMRDDLDLVVISSADDPLRPTLVDLDRLRQAGIAVVEDVAAGGTEHPMLDALGVSVFPTGIATDPSGTVVARSEGPVDVPGLVDAALAAG